MIGFTEETRGEWRVVAVTGRADAVTCEQLEHRLRAAVDKHKQVAVDFSALEYISSCGLRALLQAGREAQGRKVRFAVCSPSPAVKKVFDISGIAQILEVHQELPC